MHSEQRWKYGRITNIKTIKVQKTLGGERTVCRPKDKLIPRDWTCTELCLLYLSVCLIKLRITVRETSDTFSLASALGFAKTEATRRFYSARFRNSARRNYLAAISMMEYSVLLRSYYRYQVRISSDRIQLVSDRSAIFSLTRYNNARNLDRMRFCGAIIKLRNNSSNTRSSCT